MCQASRNSLFSMHASRATLRIRPSDPTPTRPGRDPLPPAGQPPAPLPRSPTTPPPPPRTLRYSLALYKHPCGHSSPPVFTLVYKAAGVSVPSNRHQRARGRARQASAHGSPPRAVARRRGGREGGAAVGLGAGRLQDARRRPARGRGLPARAQEEEGPRGGRRAAAPQGLLRRRRRRGFLRRPQPLDRSEPRSTTTCHATHHWKQTMARPLLELLV